MADEETKVQTDAEPMNLGDAEVPADTAATEVDIDKLVATLDKIGVRDPQHLEGLHRTAQQHGPMANELGQLREEVAQLRQAAQQPPQQRTHDPYADPYEQPQGQPVDLRGEMRSVMREFYQEDIIKPQQQASQAYWQDVETAETSEYYPMVQEEYQARIATPAFQRALSQGKTTHAQELYKIVGNKFKDISAQIKTAASMLKEQSPPGTKPPHMETTQLPPQQAPQGKEAQKQALLDIDKASTGTDEDVDAMIRTLLPDDDPILGD